MTWNVKPSSTGGVRRIQSAFPMSSSQMCQYESSTINKRLITNHQGPLLIVEAKPTLKIGMRYAGQILGLCPAYARRRCFVTTSLIGLDASLESALVTTSQTSHCTCQETGLTSKQMTKKTNKLFHSQYHPIHIKHDNISTENNDIQYV